MNLVDLIKGQLTTAVTQKLAELFGGSEPKTATALGAAVPGLLSALASLASDRDGATKLSSSISRFDADLPAKVSGWLDQNPDEAFTQGETLLSTVLSGKVLSGLTQSLTKFSGLDSVSTTKILGYLGPLVMGSIAKQFSDTEPTVQNVQKLFEDQKSNISAALPVGFSLPNLPGITDVEPAIASVSGGGSGEGPTGGNPASVGTGWKALIPIGVLAILGLFAWQFFNRQGDDAKTRDLAEVANSDAPHTVLRPALDTPIAVPDAEKFTADVQSIYMTATERLSEIKDVDSAKAALPSLTRLSDRLASLSEMTDTLPDATRESIAKISSENYGKLEKIIEQVLAIPGVEPILGPIIGGMTTKLDAFNELFQ